MTQYLSNYIYVFIIVLNSRTYIYIYIYHIFYEKHKFYAF